MTINFHNAAFKCLLGVVILLTIDSFNPFIHLKQSYDISPWTSTTSLYVYKANYDDIDSSTLNLFEQRDQNNTHRTVVTTIGFYTNLDQMIVSNHKHYCKLHNYDYFILRKQLHQYDNNGPKFGTQQRALLIWNLLFNKTFETNIKSGTTYSRVLWIDFDAIFINDNITIDQIILYSYKMNCISPKHYSNVSVIVTGDQNIALNAGVMIFKKNKFTQRLLIQWHNLMNVCNYYRNYLKLMKQGKRKQKNAHNVNSNNHDHDSLKAVTGNSKSSDQKVTYPNSNNNTSDLQSTTTTVVSGSLKFDVSFDAIVDDYKSHRRHIKKSCYLNDQQALAIILFHERLNISDSIFLKLGNYDHDVFNNNGNINTTTLSSNVIVMTQMFYWLEKNVLQDEKAPKRSGPGINDDDEKSQFCKYVYCKMVVVKAQCLRIRHQMLSKSYFNHVLWIDQEKMNSNIWSQYKNNKLLNQWIIHFAGQRNNKQDLLKMFLNYKHYMIMIDKNKNSNNINHSKIEKQNKTNQLQQQIVSYIHEQGSHKDLIQRMERSKLTYHQLMTIVDRQQHEYNHGHTHKSSHMKTNAATKYSDCSMMYVNKQRPNSKNRDRLHKNRNDKRAKFKQHRENWAGH